MPTILPIFEITRIESCVNVLVLYAMYKEAFEKLEDQDVAETLERFNPLLDGTPFKAGDTTIMAQGMNFYPGYRYLDIADYSTQPPAQRFAIEGLGKNAGQDIVLDWSNRPLYALNQKAPIVLNDETVPDYVRFFFAHVRGEHGRFLIAENVDDIRWKDDPPPEARKNLAKMLLPVIVKRVAKDGSFEVPITVMFKDSLFQCDIIVSPIGQVDITNEQVLVEDIPVLDDALGQ